MVQEVGIAAAGAGLGALVGGAVVRGLVAEWLRRRQDFEVSTEKRFVAIEERFAARFDGLREAESDARETLRKHVDDEDKILRDRYHELSNIMSKWMEKTEQNGRGVNDCTASVKDMTHAIHELDKSLTALLRQGKA